jgi:hypothetical protein
VSLEQYGAPSTFVLQSNALEEAQKLKVKEALCYLGETKVQESPRKEFDLIFLQRLSRPEAWNQQRRITVLTYMPWG